METKNHRNIWLVAAGCLLVLLLALLTRHREGQSEPETAANPVAAGGHAVLPVDAPASFAKRRGGAGAAVPQTAEEIVANKLSQFARLRRDLAHALARKHNVEVSPDVERFFDAVAAGDWAEIEARFKVINGGAPNAGHADGRPPGVQFLWPAIIDAYGAAEQAHLWPAQKLLDYGNGILDQLRPGMVYVGGTDNGRWIPELLNDTSEGEHHVVVTQNGLADGTYVEYMQMLYGDRLNTLTPQDSERAFQEYMADAQKRLEHDRQFPDEPKQVRPGESIRMVDNRVSVSGMVAVMAINERLLQALMEKNPDVPFALQESFSLKNTYPDAAPLGPLMELRAGGQPQDFSERAGQALDYWRATAQRVLADPALSASPDVMNAYSHDAAAAGNLLAAHDDTARAEEAYRLATQFAPAGLDALKGLSELLARTGRAAEGQQLLDDFARRYPDKRTEVDLAKGSVTFEARSK